MDRVQLEDEPVVVFKFVVAWFGSTLATISRTYSIKDYLRSLAYR
jgi:hypothetical protein